MIFDINTLSLQEQILFSTVRLKTEHSVGSGFIFTYTINEKNLSVIITNKHVISGANNLEMNFITKVNETQIDTNKITKINGIIGKNVILHPDKNVDLCILPIGRILDIHKDIFVSTFGESNIPSNEAFKNLKAIEDILMIGYPIGLMDEINNMPIVRKGITATHPYLNYNGKDEFVIDAACYPGSSGSPIILNRFGSYIDKKGNSIIGYSNPLILGILYAGPLQTVTGDIKTCNIPTKPMIFSESKLMINLGYVIKSTKILDFKKLIEPLIN